MTKVIDYSDAMLRLIGRVATDRHLFGKILADPENVLKAEGLSDAEIADMGEWQGQINDFRDKMSKYAARDDNPLLFMVFLGAMMAEFGFKDIDR